MRCGRFSTWESSVESPCPRKDSRNGVSGTTSRERLEQEPAPRLIVPARLAEVVGVGQRHDQEPGQPGQFDDRQELDPERPKCIPPVCPAPGAAGLRSRTASERGPDGPRRKLLFPHPFCSLLVGAPLATSRIISKRRRPTLSTGSPSRMGPASRSMSSIIRSYIGVLVVTLMHGRRLQTQHAPTSRGEHQHVGPAGDQPGRAGGIIARRVHENQARACRPARHRGRRRPGRSSRPWPGHRAISRRSSSTRRPCCLAKGCC